MLAKFGGEVTIGGKTLRIEPVIGFIGDLGGGIDPGERIAGCSAAQGVLLYHGNLLSLARKVECAGAADDAAPDNDDVVLHPASLIWFGSRERMAAEAGFPSKFRLWSSRGTRRPDSSERPKPT